MTVRTWFTLSALILVALCVAIVAKLLAPASPPAILARVDETRLEGALVEGCWPQRGDDLRCEEGGDADPERRTIPPEGEFRVVVAFPTDPEDGSVRVVDEDGEPVIDEDWDERVPYELDPGDYELEVRADYPAEARVAYTFPFTVTR